MLRRVLAIALGVVLGFSCLSCNGTAPGLATATGKVISGGKPAAGAVLAFHRQPGGSPPPANAAGIIPSARVQEDGTFAVESYPLGSGIAPGTYKVLIQWGEESQAGPAGDGVTSKSISSRGKNVTVTRRNKFGNVQEDRLKGRYADVEKTPFKAEIKEGTNDLGTYEIEMK
jgi:hypothetical protein